MMRWVLLALLVTAVSEAKENFDEAAVPPYTLPDPLVAVDGSRIATPAHWQANRAALLALMRREMYGADPGRPRGLRFQRFDLDPHALGGLATREQVRILFTGTVKGPGMDLLIYRPNGVQGPVPTILGLNFWGNHTIHADPGIRLASTWSESSAGSYCDLRGVQDGHATDACRGVNARMWPVETLLRHGFALATAYRGDVCEDRATGLQTGVLPAWPELQQRGDNFAAIGAWAWALSRALDYLATDPAIDARRVAVFGWSRLGKAALWAGASDERFALTISHESGAGGAALSKRLYGEDVERLNRVFPHWFCANFRRFSSQEAGLPFDQHQVIALCAPRPVYVGSAEGDKGADPRGEFLAAKAAEPVYKLFGQEGLPAATWPAVNQPSAGTIGYHLRPGPHDVLAYDWERYLEFMARWLR